MAYGLLKVDREPSSAKHLDGSMLTDYVVVTQMSAVSVVLTHASVNQTGARAKIRAAYLTIFVLIGLFAVEQLVHEHTKSKDTALHGIHVRSAFCSWLIAYQGLWCLPVLPPAPTQKPYR